MLQQSTDCLTKGHSILVGQTGSGKSTLLVRLIMDSKGVIERHFILDTKHDSSFVFAMRNKKYTIINVIEQLNEIHTLPDYVIIRPYNLEPEYLDSFIFQAFYYSDKAFRFYIDEGYMIHSEGGRCFKGLKLILTQGRSFHRFVTLATQRPAFITNFAFSETMGQAIFSLTLNSDIKKLDSNVGDIRKEISSLKPYHFFLIDRFNKTQSIHKPIKV
jgi:DNA helicase HerA-like ATPase